LVYISMSGSKVFVNEEFASGANRKIANGKNWQQMICGFFLRQRRVDSSISADLHGFLLKKITCYFEKVVLKKNNFCDNLLRLKIQVENEPDKNLVEHQVMKIAIIKMFNYNEDKKLFSNRALMYILLI